MASVGSQKKDCNICYETFTNKQIVTCCLCSFEACKNCVKTQIELTKNASCMNCKCTFTKKFLTENVGVTFVKTTWKKIEEDVLIEREREQLTATQPLVTWEKEFRRQKSRIRFGERMTIPERPTESSNANIKDFFPCPNNSCRGFIEPGAKTCSVCSSNVCRLCREISSDPSTHVCNPDTLMTISMLREDSRPCPKCAAMINRSFGCNHMHCTHCRTHFDWESGKILTISTNGHYSNLQSFARNLVVRGQNQHNESTTNNNEQQQEDEECREVNLREIPRNQLRQEIPSDVLRILYDDLEIIRFAADSMYNEATLNLQLMNTLTNLRVAFLMNDIDESVWKSKVYSTNKNFQYRLHCARVFHLYIQNIYMFQHRLHESTDLVDVIEIRNLIELTNESFRGLAEEYNSNVVIHLRNINDPITVPALTR
jgi:hypothetical protein